MVEQKQHHNSGEILGLFFAEMNRGMYSRLFVYFIDGFCRSCLVECLKTYGGELRTRLIQGEPFLDTPLE